MIIPDPTLADNPNRLMYDENGEQTIPHREWVILFNDVVKEVKAEMEAAGRGDEFVGAKVGARQTIFLYPTD